jgi:hypothetical protein
MIREASILLGHMFQPTFSTITCHDLSPRLLASLLHTVPSPNSKPLVGANRVIALKEKQKKHDQKSVHVTSLLRPPVVTVRGAIYYLFTPYLSYRGMIERSHSPLDSRH